MATFHGTKYISSIIFRSDIMAIWIKWPERSGPRWPLYPKRTVAYSKSKPVCINLIYYIILAKLSKIGQEELCQFGNCLNT